MHFFSVCDGHGSYGDDVSQFIKMHLSDILREEIKKHQSSNKEHLYKVIFEKVYHQCNLNLNQNHQLQTKNSGSTVCSVLLDGNMIHCANIGDSRAVIFSDNGDKNEIQAKPISNDHKPDLPEEMARIVESGGRVESSYGSKNGP